MVGSGQADPSPIMVTFLNMATSTVYKMAGLGAFKSSQTYKTVMGETGEADEDVKEEEVTGLDEEEKEEVDSDELVEKGTVALTETSTHWLLTVAGTCIDMKSEEAVKSSVPVAGVGRGEVAVENASLDLEDRWSQTLDLPRKKKGTQCDAINMAPEGAQASNIDIFESTRE